MWVDVGKEEKGKDGGELEGDRLSLSYSTQGNLATLRPSFRIGYWYPGAWRRSCPSAYAIASPEHIYILGLCHLENSGLTLFHLNTLKVLRVPTIQIYSGEIRCQTKLHSARSDLRPSLARGVAINSD